MFSEKDLQSLLDYSTEGGQVLSLYLNTDPGDRSAEATQLVLKQYLKAIDLPEDVRAIEQYMNLTYDWTSKGLVIFSQQGGKALFKVFKFNLPVWDKVSVGERPLLRPLLRLMDAFSGWGIALADSQKVCLFSFDLGEVEEKKVVLGDDIKQVKHGGGTAVTGRMGGTGAGSSVDNLIDRNVKEAAEVAGVFFTRTHIRRIMLGGTEENIARFRQALLKTWQSLVVGDLPIQMSASEFEIVEMVLREAEAIQETHASRLVDQAITLAAKGGPGAKGLIDTLNANHEGRIKTLLVDEHFEQAGYRCFGCGYLTVQELGQCPFCGGTFETIPAAVEMAVRESLLKNADVKVLRENEA
ncbi:MAG: hypothetical protein H0S82_08625, partial [Anaerolineaceae bacterium]|nr:hypothetical protein [Anaerolineaceae bacterium]